MGCTRFATAGVGERQGWGQVCAGVQQDSALGVQELELTGGQYHHLVSNLGVRHLVQAQLTAAGAETLKGRNPGARQPQS
jgi:hypothetical protein